MQKIKNNCQVQLYYNNMCYVIKKQKKFFKIDMCCLLRFTLSVNKRFNEFSPRKIKRFVTQMTIYPIYFLQIAFCMLIKLIF